MIYRFLVVSKYQTLSGSLIDILIRNGSYTDEKFPHPNLCHASNFNIDDEKKKPCFSYTQASIPPSPSHLPHTLQYGSENMAFKGIKRFNIQGIADKP